MNRTHLGHYGSYIENIDRLTPKEEKELSKQIKLGNITARNKLVSANLKLVLSIAYKYINNGVALEELVAEGNKWLITAADRFDSKKDVNFSTYAYFWIRQGIVTLIKENNEWGDMIIKLSPEDNQHFEKFLYNEVIMDESQTYSYFQNIEEENDKYINENLFNEVILHLDKLTERESNIIKHYYGICNKEELNVGEISKKYKITPMSVSNIIESSIKKVRCAILENS